MRKVTHPYELVTEMQQYVEESYANASRKTEAYSIFEDWESIIESCVMIGYEASYNEGVSSNDAVIMIITEVHSHLIRTFRCQNIPEHYVPCPEELFETLEDKYILC